MRSSSRSWTAGGPGDHIARLEPRGVVTRPVGDDAAGLAHEERAGGDVPRSERLLEVAVEHAGRAPREVERRRARRDAGPRTCAARARRPGSTRRGARASCGTGSRSRRSPRRRSRSLISEPLVVAPRAATAPARCTCRRAAARRRRRRSGRRPRRARSTRATTGKRCRKFAVPSSGSTSHPSVVRSPPSSSPTTGMSGAAASSAARTARSLAVSVSLTQSPGAFATTLRARAERVAHDGAAGVRRADARRRAERRGRASSCDRRDRAAELVEQRRGRCRRSAGDRRVGVGGDELAAVRRRRRARRPRGRRAARRGSPTATARLRASMPTRRCGRRPVAQAQRGRTQDRGTASSPGARRERLEGDDAVGDTLRGRRTQRSDRRTTHLHPVPRSCAPPSHRWRRASRAGRRRSSAQSEIDQYGMPRGAVRRPVDGIDDDGDRRHRSGRSRPDSSLTTATPAGSSTSRIAASATTSSAYWPACPSARARRCDAVERADRRALRVERGVEEREELTASGGSSGGAIVTRRGRRGRRRRTR